MITETECLARRWVETFGEPPTILDPVLMRAVLKEYGGDAGADADRACRVAPR